MASNGSTKIGHGRSAAGQACTTLLHSARSLARTEYEAVVRSVT